MLEEKDKDEYKLEYGRNHVDQHKLENKYVQHDIKEKNELDHKEEHGHNLEVKHARDLKDEDGCDAEDERN